MEETEKIMMAQKWVRQLANGINPLNGGPLKEDDIVNNVHISRCLFFVVDVLGKHTERRTKPKSVRVVPFDSSAMQKDNYNYTDVISISAFAREVEKLIPENMKSVSYKSMTHWLVQEGLIQDSAPDDSGRISKIATEKGKTMGIHTEERENNNGAHYLLTLYNQDAQRFLLEHIEEISQVPE